VPKCTPDSLEISVNKIESLKGLNQLRSRTKQYYNYSNYTSITYTTLGYFYRTNRWHSAPEADKMPQPTPDSFDSYVNMELSLPRGQDDTMEFARVLKRKKDNDGNLIGIANDNPILDSRVYIVEWSDGRTEELMANIIVENLFAQVDDEEHRYVLLDDNIDHRSTGDYISGDDGTQGWELCIQWKDHSANWVKLKDMKNAYPIEVAEYAIANKIHEEPAFAWWVPSARKKRNRFISKVKSKY
jgi:hypothetical protein